MLYYKLTNGDYIEIVQYQDDNFNYKVDIKLFNGGTTLTYNLTPDTFLNDIIEKIEKDYSSLESEHRAFEWACYTD